MEFKNLVGAGGIMGPKAGLRAKLFRGIHAEAVKRKLDHDALHDMCVREFGVASMGAMSDQQLVGLYKSWTGKGLKTRSKLPRRGEAERRPVIGMVTGEDLTRLEMEFAARGMGLEGRKNFVRRQLGGRETIFTRRDYARVFHGIRAMNRRDGLSPGGISEKGTGNGAEVPQDKGDEAARGGDRKVAADTSAGGAVGAPDGGGSEGGGAAGVGGVGGGSGVDAGDGCEG